MSVKIYDASALLAVVFDEAGGDQVLQHLAQPGGAVTAVNWSETAAKMLERGMALREVKSELAHFTLEVVAVDAAMALVAAELRASTRALGLSLGDRCCLALAKTNPGSTVLTADKAWKTLKGFDIQPIR